MKARIRESLRATPLQPFVIRLADGRGYRIGHPDFVLAASQSGRSRPSRLAMPRIVRGGLIQQQVTHDGTAPLEVFKRPMIENAIGYIENAGEQGAQVVCLHELFYGPIDAP